ncbi:MAG: cytochrome D ubiquinol oxidase subunit II, partial [Candidatus Omnitrophota bacterium]
RYVLGLTVIRLNREISDKTLKRINQEFKDILASGEIKRSLPIDKEVQEKEFLGLPRLAMNFNLRGYGRLCEMIQIINKD